jgi:hypothetical protein
MPPVTLRDALVAWHFTPGARDQLVRGRGSGVAALLVMGSVGEQDALAEQVGFRAAVYLLVTSAPPHREGCPSRSLLSDGRPTPGRMGRSALPSVQVKEPGLPSSNRRAGEGYDGPGAPGRAPTWASMPSRSMMPQCSARRSPSARYQCIAGMAYGRPGCRQHGLVRRCVRAERNDASDILHPPAVRNAGSLLCR